MGWALRDAGGKVIAVAMSREGLPQAPDAWPAEIPDDTAMRVLSGTLPMSHVFDPPPQAQPVTAAPARRRGYTSRYPAMMTDGDVDSLANIAAMLPWGATVVEVGSRLGGSAKVILEAAPGIKRMYCIDSEWQLAGSTAMDDPSMSTIVDAWGARGFGSCMAFAAHYLRDHPSVRLLAKASPYDLGWWSETVDFVFEDSSHANPQLTDNIWFWWDRLRSGGIMAGHDYGSGTYPDVSTAVGAFSSATGVPFAVTSNVWWMAKP